MESKFHQPVRGINNSNDLDNFKKSETFAELSGFVKACADAVASKKTSDEMPVSAVISKIVEFMNRLYDLVGEFPPLKQPMRFGNRAFKQFHSRLCELSPAFVADILQGNSADANFEVASYLNTAFGNETRIDYGTGHELSFAVFLLCLFKLKVIGKADLTAAVLKSFAAYLRVIRRLNQEYLLEPAGSHGVWGLDDYHCLVFVWGAAQLVGHPDIAPKSIHDSEVLDSGAEDYLYLSGIQFVKVIDCLSPLENIYIFLYPSAFLNDTYFHQFAKFLTLLMFYCV